MRRRFRAACFALLAVLAVALVLVGAGCSSGNDDEGTTPSNESPSNNDTGSVTEPSTGEEALAGACTTCHDVTRIYLQSEMTQWSDVINKMESAHGAVLSDDEKAAIEEFLSSREPKVGEQLIQGKCTTCHGTENIYEAASDTDWQAVLDRMVETHGAELTAQEQADIIAYLNSVK